MNWKVRGSPPRVRGTGTYRGLMTKRYRITPACAGNRKNWRCLCWYKWDHPRVCGEQSLWIQYVVVEPGSPPRVRGTAYFHRPAIHINGITPACAGNSCWPPCFPSLTEDHPRVCGEQFLPDLPCKSLIGSPPRVRGTEFLRAKYRCAGGITPACAGNSL